MRDGFIDGGVARRRKPASDRLRGNACRAAGIPCDEIEGVTLAGTGWERRADALRRRLCIRCATDTKS